MISREDTTVENRPVSNLKQDHFQTVAQRRANQPTYSQSHCRGRVTHPSHTNNTLSAITTRLTVPGVAAIIGDFQWEIIVYQG